jgi:two-component system, cell cycle response regulator
MSLHASRFDELKAATRLPSSPSLAAKIVHVLGRPDVELAELVALAQSDPASTGRVLKRANSAWPGRPTASVPEAIRRIGIEAAREAVLDLAVVEKSLLQEHSLVPEKSPGAFDHNRFWTLSYLRAVAARELAPRSDIVCPDEAFSCALLARIGELVLATIYPTECALMLDEVTQNGQSSRPAAERSRFGITSLQLGAALLHDWGFPSFFIDAILKTSDLSAAATNGSSRLRVVAGLLRTAERIALYCLDHLDSTSTPAPALVLAGDRLDVPSQDCSSICDAVRRQWQEWKQRNEPRPSAPAAVRVPVARPAAVIPAKRVTTSLEILLAEDNPVQRKLIASMLTAAGHKVLTAENGKTGLRMALEHQPDIILSDWQMPGMDGLELCAALRCAKVGQSIYFILITGEGDEAILVNAFDRGVDDFVAKPLSPKVLQARLKAAARMIAIEAQVRDERARLRQLAGELADANRRLESASLTDFLTELPNRRFFMQQMEQHWRAAVRRSRRLACLLIDVDHFKAINDRYGHAVGDLVLKELAATLRQNKRHEDIICRYGGEEFAILLPESDEEVAQLVAERFRAAAEAEIVQQLAVLNEPVTVSIGLAFRKPQTPGAADLLQAADEALYRAKREGRNRVCVKPTLEPVAVGI